MSLPIIVLDANILIRAILGNKVRNYLINFNDSIDFFTPDICIEDTEKYLPILFEKRNLPYKLPLEIFLNIKKLLKIIDANIYQECDREAKRRMKNRDIKDWPIVATALLFNCPIWTEDKDFFGVGVPLWTTDRIHLFFDSIYENTQSTLLVEET